MSRDDQKRTFKAAIVTFMTCASLIYILALGYSIKTQNYLATVLLSFVILGTGSLAFWLFRSETK